MITKYTLIGVNGKTLERGAATNGIALVFLDRDGHNMAFVSENERPMRGSRKTTVLSWRGFRLKPGELSGGAKLHESSIGDNPQITLPRRGARAELLLPMRTGDRRLLVVRENTRKR